VHPLASSFNEVERAAILPGELDHVGKNTASLVAILRKGWGTPVPFIGSSYRAEEGAVAAVVRITGHSRSPEYDERRYPNAR
jgi:hypothetical protein